QSTIVGVWSSFVLLRIFFFFFSSRRRHTRFSRDWSSDVCSSDLPHPLARIQIVQRIPPQPVAEGHGSERRHVFLRGRRAARQGRSEERRVGKECRSRWSPDQ